jgi:BirA family biotin operon repressor/biotin-[acetyl-CoA-carboxylase] ligase
LTLISAVAICEALGKQLNLSARIKWPNDILIDSRKVVGILTELSAEMDIVHAIIVGVGINVNSEKKNLPYPAASLKEITGSEVNRLSLLQSILGHFEDEYIQFQKQGLEKILNKWRNFSTTLGKRVKLNLSGHRLALVGEAVDIDRDGSLLIRKDSGLIERVMAGDIIHCKR